MIYRDREMEALLAANLSNGDVTVMWIASGLPTGHNRRAMRRDDDQLRQRTSNRTICLVVMHGTRCANAGT
jgi:hypothetical protein